MALNVTDFVKKLKNCGTDPDTFNPWADYDQLYDRTPKAPGIRQKRLTDYLSCRIEQARYILLAEAVGYQGAKFSGVPLTSERILLGKQKGICASNILPIGLKTRLSNPETAPSQAVQNLGYAEPTATIVWQLLQELSISTYEIILWNIFPIHPFNLVKGRLSNRTPRQEELVVGKTYLDLLINLCPASVKLIAIGEKAAATIGKQYPKVRHPANGGARKFRNELPQLIA